MSTSQITQLVRSDVLVLDNPSPRGEKIPVPYTLTPAESEMVISTSCKRGGFLPKIQDCANLADDNLWLDEKVVLNTTAPSSQDLKNSFSFPLSDLFD